MRKKGENGNALQVQTLLLAPICPHTCEHVWRSKLHEKGSVLTAGWPQAPQPNTALQVCSPPPPSHALHLLVTMQPLSRIIFGQGRDCPAVCLSNTVMAQGCICPGLYLFRGIMIQQCACNCPGLSLLMVVFAQGCVCPGLSLPRVVIAQGCFCLGLSLPRAVFAQGCLCPGFVFAQGCVCPGLSLPRVVFAQGCICPGLYHSLPRCTCLTCTSLHHLIAV